IDEASSNGQSADPADNGHSASAFGRVNQLASGGLDPAHARTWRLATASVGTAAGRAGRGGEGSLRVALWKPSDRGRYPRGAGNALATLSRLPRAIRRRFDIDERLRRVAGLPIAGLEFDAGSQARRASAEPAVFGECRPATAGGTARAACDRTRHRFQVGTSCWPRLQPVSCVCWSSRRSALLRVSWPGDERTAATEPDSGIELRLTAEAVWGVEFRRRKSGGGGGCGAQARAGSGVSDGQWHFGGAESFSGNEQCKVELSTVTMELTVDSADPRLLGLALRLGEAVFKLAPTRGRPGRRLHRLSASRRVLRPPRLATPLIVRSDPRLAERRRLLRRFPDVGLRTGALPERRRLQGRRRRRRNNFVCECPAGLGGSRCQSGLFCGPDVSPCQHGGRCEESPAGAVCHCGGTGFTGPSCSEDVDECSIEASATPPCGVGGICTSTCRVVSGATAPWATAAGTANISTARSSGQRSRQRRRRRWHSRSGLSTVELVAISGASAIILLLALMVFLCVSCCLRRRQRRGRCVNGAANGKLAQQQQQLQRRRRQSDDGTDFDGCQQMRGDSHVAAARAGLRAVASDANLRLLREADAGPRCQCQWRRRRRSSFLLLAGFNVFSGSGGCCCSRGSCIGRHADSLLDAE
uniref:EGF-like domain-containing protein n=1 Tax=Macrostomum lignano TaxID=282301 RepID=A0A1I8F746_9PLAT